MLGYRNLNLFKLFRLVHKLGGFDNVSIIIRSEMFFIQYASLGIIHLLAFGNECVAAVLCSLSLPLCNILEVLLGVTLSFTLSE